MDWKWAWQGWICSWILTSEIFSNQDSMMIIMIVEKRNVFLKREIHYSLLGVGKEENIVNVVLTELSLNFFLSVSSRQQILECDCTSRTMSTMADPYS